MMLGGRHAWRATSWAMSADVGQNLADDFVGDLGHAVLLARVHRDLFEDPLFGLGGERRRTTGDHGTTRECLHRSDLLSVPRPPSGRRTGESRRKIALCCEGVTLA